jgi:hypothetical protein
VIDQEYFNDFFVHLRDHYGWAWIDHEDIRYLNTLLNTSFPLNEKELGEWFPEFLGIKLDYNTVDYQYTFNPVKDGNLDVNNAYGVKIHEDGKISFEH